MLSLADYRLRPAQYKSDADSKTLHARLPMIAVWDDHEIANDAYKDGAENHDAATEGSWATRRAAALQAFHEWMPIRTGAAYLTAKATPAAERTPVQAALMDPRQNPKLGYNLDAWDGYLAARETVLGAALSLGKKLVTLAGDTHNAWHSDLTLMGLSNPALAGVKVGEEFATSSVSSPSLESYLALPSAQVKGIFEGVVDDLKWLDPSRRGYLKMRFTATEACGEWIFVDTITNRSYQSSSGRTASYAA